MISVSAPGLTESYLYDGDGNKVSQTVNGVTNNYLIDTRNVAGYPQVIEEIQGGIIQKVYTYGTTRISQDALVSGSYVRGYYGYDGQGSVRFLMDSTGNVTDQYTYSSFGETLFKSGATDNAFLYDSEQQDGNTGFYNLRARWMNPGVGRFISVDSKFGHNDDPLSLHKYMFVDDNPENKVDPSGYDSTVLGNFREIYNKIWGKTVDIFTPATDISDPQGIQFIKDAEGFEDQLYDHDGSTTGTTTIGYGHKVHSGPIDGSASEKPWLGGITEPEADKLLRSADLPGYVANVKTSVKVPLKQFQFDALVDYSFNRGNSGFRKDSFLVSLNNGDYQTAAMRIESSGRQRRRAEAYLFRTGVYLRNIYDVDFDLLNLGGQ